MISKMTMPNLNSLYTTLIEISTFKKGDEKWPLFVNKQLFWWSASIILDNNNGLLTDFYPFFSHYILPHTSVGLTGCISDVFFSFEYFD